MQSPLINRLGNWNPQFLRECRGRLNTRTLSATIALTAIAQVLLLLTISQFSDSSPQEKWLAIWSSLKGFLPFLFFVLGSYYLVNDLTYEQKQGTLNFIRLSPRPAWQILLGKLLGVPILGYLVLALTLPLHVVATVGAGISILHLLSFYLMLLVSGVFCYSAAMLFALVGSAQPRFANRQSTIAISFAAIALFVLAPLFSTWNTAVTWRPFHNTAAFGEDIPTNIFWFYIPINERVWVSHGFTLLHLGIVTFLIWRLLLRRFRQPRATVISKRQSYGILFYTEVLTLGFALPVVSIYPAADLGIAGFANGLTASLLLLLFFGICPQRQALSDWVRYQPQGWQSYIWTNKSPALIAILILLMIANALLLPWELMLDGKIGRAHV